MGLPKNNINTPLDLTKEQLMEKLESLITEHRRVVANSEDIMLQLIEEREKLMNILKIINK